MGRSPLSGSGYRAFSPTLCGSAEGRAFAGEWDVGPSSRHFVGVQRAAPFAGERGVPANSFLLAACGGEEEITSYYRDILHFDRDILQIPEKFSVYWFVINIDKTIDCLIMKRVIKRICLMRCRGQRIRII